MVTTDFCPQGCYWDCEHRVQAWTHVVSDDLARDAIKLTHRMPLTLEEADPDEPCDEPIEEHLRRAFEPSEATRAALDDVRTYDMIYVPRRALPPMQATTYTPTRPQTSEAIYRELALRCSLGSAGRSFHRHRYLVRFVRIKFQGWISVPRTTDC